MPLTGKRNNQSVLDKDASIYQIQEEESEKQKWSKLNTRQRLKYFQDYYLLKFLIGILAVIIVVSVIWTTLKPRDENTLSIAVVKNYLIPEGKKALEQQLEELLITGEHQKINIDDTFPDGYETEAKLSVYLSAQEIDLIITNEEHFKEHLEFHKLIMLLRQMQTLIRTQQEIVVPGTSKKMQIEMT